MNCEIATIVYSHSNPLAKIQEIFPLAWNFLNNESLDYLNSTTNDFDYRLSQIVGTVDFKFLGNHRVNESELSHQLQELIGDLTSRLLLEDHFSNLIGTPIHFALLCCDGHLSTDRELTLKEALAFQKAAITIR
jgi:hypothetical protein